MTTVVCVPLYSVGFSYRGLAPWTCALCFEVDRRTGRRYRQPVDRPPGDRRPVQVDPAAAPAAGWVAGEGGVAAWRIKAPPVLRALPPPARCTTNALPATHRRAFFRFCSTCTVSYTHLTLPTN